MCAGKPMRASPRTGERAMSHVNSRAGERWARAHALLLLGATLVCTPLRLVWPAALVGTASVLWMVLAELRAGAGPARLGAANAVTLGRLVLVVGLSLRLQQQAGPFEAALVLLVFALDGVDGAIARRTGTVSALGARFDVEADALFVLVCALGLYACDRVGAYVLVPGVLRYAFELALVQLPRMRRGEPRRQLARWAFALMIVSFAVSAWPLFPQHALLAMVASAGIAASFARSVYWSLRSV